MYKKNIKKKRKSQLKVKVSKGKYIKSMYL